MTPLRRVLVIFTVWCAGLGAAAQFAKMSVIYDQLGGIYPDHRGVGIGIMVSVIGIIGLLFGTAAGVLVTRIGPRRTMLAALALGAVISLMQSLLPPYSAMVASRIPEGLSHLAIVVVGPTAMAGAASVRFQGLVMTLWGSFFGLTFTVMAYFGPSLVALHGPGLLFQFHAVWMVLCLAALAVLMPADPVRIQARQGGGVLAQHLATYASPQIAAPAMGFVCYTVTYVAALTLLPGAVTPGWGGSIAVAMPLTSIFISLTLGVALLNVISAVEVVQAGFGAAIAAAAGLWLTWGSGAPEAGFALLLASAMGVVQGASFAMIPQLNPEPAGRAQAAGAIAQLGNLGTTTGTPLMAVLLARHGVNGLAVFLIGFSMLGIMLHRWQAWRRAV